MVWWRLGSGVPRRDTRRSGSGYSWGARGPLTYMACHTPGRRSVPRALGAERIGHRMRSIEDPALVKPLAEHRILLQVCPTSNLRLGVPPNYASHPLPRLLAADIHLTVNSDDPRLFNTTFKDEAALLPEPFGFGLGEIDELILNGVRHSFLLPQRKQDIEPTFRAE